MNNILEATLQIKDKNIISIITFKRRYLKRENHFTSHIRINQNFVLSVGCVSQNNNIVKTARKTRITLCSVSQAYRPTKSTAEIVENVGSSFTADY